MLLQGQTVQQAGIEARDLRFQGFDMVHHFVQNKTMAGTQIALQRIQNLLPAGLEAMARQGQYLLRRGALNQRLDHGACRLTMNVADHHAQADPPVGQHLV